jgi:hypothetical protein
MNYLSQIETPNITVLCIFVCIVLYFYMVYVILKSPK